MRPYLFPVAAAVLPTSIFDLAANQMMEYKDKDKLRF